MNITPERLYHLANNAAMDAARYRRDPNGGPLANVRRNDAADLRARARQMLTGGASG